MVFIFSYSAQQVTAARLLLLAKESGLVTSLPLCLSSLIITQMALERHTALDDTEILQAPHGGENALREKRSQDRTI